MSWMVWWLIAFAAGSLPFSVWITQLVARTDIRAIGDRNPGTTNAFRGGGWRAGVPSAALDFLKGAVPVGLAHFTGGAEGAALGLVALAPVLGHAFSPWLGFRGGKGLAVTLGSWFSLIPVEGAVVLGLAFLFMVLLQTSDAWAVVGGMVVLLGWIMLRGAQPAWLLAWPGFLAILVLKHQSELRHQVPRLRLLRTPPAAGSS